MFKVKTGGINYSVWFRHVKNKTINGTVAEIFNDDKKILIVEDIANCHASDQFNKSFGRKLAFTRAIEGFSKSTRRDFWEAYKQNHRIENNRKGTVVISKNNGNVIVRHKPSDIKVVIVD